MSCRSGSGGATRDRDTVTTGAAATLGARALAGLATVPRLSQTRLCQRLDLS